MRRSSFVLAVALTVAIGVGLARPARAQQAGVTDLSWSTIDQGGGRVSGGVYTLDGTAGQADAMAPMSGGVYAVTSGYWPGVQTAAAPTPLFKDGFE